MSTNEVVYTPADIPVESPLVDFCATPNSVSVVESGVPDLAVEGYKREYAIVGDAYFATVTAGETPGWIVDIINDLVDSGLEAALTDVGALKTSVLEALREVDVAKNQYQELINIEATIDSIITSRLATINANLDTANAQIIELQSVKVTADQATAIAANQISSELNSPGGMLYGAITNIQTTISSLNGTVDAYYHELYDLNENTAYVLTLEINRVEASIEGVAESVIESMDLALASDVEAVAQRVTTLTSVVGDSSAGLVHDMETFATSLGTIGARYGVQLKTGGQSPTGGSSQLVGGFELLNTGSVVSAGFDVDEFWIGRVGQNGRYPFQVVGNVVYMNSAMIRDGTITNAKIGNEIRSNVFNASEGWRLLKTGDATFRNIQARGTLSSTDFNTTNPENSPGWGVFSDGRAFFNAPVISRPHIVSSGELTMQSPGNSQWEFAHFVRISGVIVPHPNTGRDGYQMFYVTVPRSDYSPDAVHETSGRMLTAQALITNSRYYFAGEDGSVPGGYHAPCSAEVERVAVYGGSEATSYIRIALKVPSPSLANQNIRAIHITAIKWALCEFT